MIEVVRLLRQLTVQMQRTQALQISEGHWSNQVDRVPRQGQIHQAGHVDKVVASHFCNEVVGQPQLDGASVDVRGHEQEALVGAERAE